MDKVYNYLGEDITSIKPDVADDSFGYRNKDGVLVINWEAQSDLKDSKGFDKTVQFENGDYTEEVTLPKGTMLCRYGFATGRFTALAGTPYENLALPYKPETIPYMQYRVVADGLKVKLRVVKGVVAPMFASKGGVIQFMHFHPINVEVDELHLLEEDWSWLEKKN